MAITKKDRLPKKHIAQIFQTGRSFHGDSVGVKVVRTTTGEHGIAVVVPVRIAAKAVVRNTLRRKVSEALRPLIPQLDPACLVVVSVRTATLPSPQTLKTEVMAVLKKSGILNR